MTFQDIILTLQNSGLGRTASSSSHMMWKRRRHDESSHILAFIRPRTLECSNMWEPSRRPADGRYGDNPNRLFQHHQYQVIMKPSPANIQDCI